MRYSCGHVSTKKNVRGIKDAATSTPPQLRSSRYIRYRDNIGYPRYGERYDIGDNQYSSNNLSYCPINRFLESITILSCLTSHANYATALVIQGKFAVACAFCGALLPLLGGFPPHALAVAQGVDSFTKQASRPATSGNVHQDFARDSHTRRN